MDRDIAQDWEQHVLLGINGVGQKRLQITVKHVICNDLIELYIRLRIDTFHEKLDKRLDGTYFVDDVGDDFHIDDVNEADDSAHRDRYNNLSDEEYEEMMTEERPNQDDIHDAAYGKYISAEVIMYMPGELPRRATVRRRVGYLDGTKVGIYHRNPLMDT